MNIEGTRIRTTPGLQAKRLPAVPPRTEAERPEGLDSVTFSSSVDRRSPGKGFKLGTAFWGALGATVSAMPLIGTWAIAKGSAALPWAMDTEFNGSRHSTLKSVACGVGGLIGGAALNLGGTLACAATGNLLPMIPAAVAGGYLFGKMAHIDSTLGKWDLFG
jgi:hypothetical protein